jgi:hypothetical protein
MIKAKFGDALPSKTDVEVVNEALCKIVCHNLRCLIQSAHELGITATFWRKDGRAMAIKSELCELADALAWM